MKHKKQASELGIAMEYWQIKSMGSIEELAKRHGITRPTVIRIAYDHEAEAKEAIEKLRREA